MDNYLTYMSAAVQAFVIVLLIRRRIYKDFPLFSAYLVWVLVAAVASVFAVPRMQPNLYNRVFFISSVFDAAFLFSVLVEMSMSVLKPVRSMLPRWSTFAVAGAMGLVSLCVWHIASPPGMMKVSKMSQYIIHLDIATSTLRILFFLLLAGLSQLLSLGLRDRVMQISTGLGFFSLVSLGVTFLHMNQGVGETTLNHLYHMLDRVVAFSYIASMVYWISCFAKDVRERQEFTPRMRVFIETLTQNARVVRDAMSDPNAKSRELY